MLASKVENGLEYCFMANFSVSLVIFLCPCTEIRNYNTVVSGDCVSGLFNEHY